MISYGNQYNNTVFLLQVEKIVPCSNTIWIKFDYKNTNPQAVVQQTRNGTRCLLCILTKFILTNTKK